MAKQSWRLYTYDLLPDGEGGKDVNDMYRRGVIEFKIKAGANMPTERQVARAVGARSHTYDGDCDVIYARDRRGDPSFELRRI